MSLSQTLTTSFKQQLLQGVHDFDTDTFYMALYTAVADLNATTTVYTVTGEVVGTGYTAPGIVMTGISVSVTDTTAFVNFSNVVWTAALTARGALIYNSSKSNKAVAVLDFGADKTSTTTFTVAMPTNSSTSALIRLP
jgi:uncharacterized membrane-anchored protein